MSGLLFLQFHLNNKMMPFFWVNLRVLYYYFIIYYFFIIIYYYYLIFIIIVVLLFLVNLRILYNHVGWMYEVARNYRLPFLLNGVFILLSFLVLLPISCWPCRLKRLGRACASVVLQTVVSDNVVHGGTGVQR